MLISFFARYIIAGILFRQEVLVTLEMSSYKTEITYSCPIFSSLS